MKRTLAALIASAMAITSVPVFADTTDVFIVGDSTACEYGNDDNYALPRAGWGMYIEKYLDGAKVTNLAMSGRSSKSFTTEENYQTLLDSVGEGDYVLIQFGHNDSKNTKEEDIQLRYTDPEGDKDTEGSFKHSLYANYILPIQEKGATPVLLTPITRRNFGEDGKVTDNHGLYDDAIRELAEETGVICIDMTACTTSVYNSIHEDGAMYFHAIYSDREKGKNGIDNTHLNHWGGEQIAYLTAEQLQDQGVLKLAASLDETPLTRGQFVKSLVRVLQLTSDSTENFADVDANADYAEAVAQAKALGIVMGDENAKFDGERIVTPQEMLLMLERGLKAAGADIAPETGTNMAERVNSAVAALNAIGIDAKANYGTDFNAADCYASLTDAYNKVTEIKALEAEAEQSVDEIEKTETVVLN